MANKSIRLTKQVKEIRYTKAGLEAADRASGGKIGQHFLQTALDDPKFVEQFKVRFLEAAVGNYDFDDEELKGFRRLTASRRDVSPMKFDRAMQLSFYQWQRNPLAQTLIRIPVDFCVGDDLNVKVKIKRRVKGKEDEDTKKPDAQQRWSDFWEDPVNNLENDLRDFVQDLLLNGELIIPVTSNLRMKDEDDKEIVEGDGTVRLGYIDPLNIKEVKTDPKNIRQALELILTVPNSTEEIPLKVIQVDTDAKSKTFNRRVGETFYWRINKITNQTRGNGELVALLDWLDALDQFLFDALEGFRLRNAFFYQLELQGLSQKQIEEKQREIKTPRTGTVRVVNEKAKWQVITPDLKAVDINTALKTFLQFVVGVGKTMPIHWFGSGDDANLASAKVMSVPTMRMLRTVQKVVRRIVKDMVYFVTDQAILAGQLKLEKDEYIECDISMFDFEKADSSVVASALVQLVNAMVVATDKEWISNETARKAIHGFVTRLGVEIDQDAEEKLARDGMLTDPDVLNVQDIYDAASKKNGDILGKLPLAIQQLALARQRAVDVGDKVLAKEIGDKIDELLQSISVKEN